MKNTEQSEVIAENGYEYSATRIRAMKARLIKNEGYEKFLKMDEREIIKFLEETQYKNEIDALELKYPDRIELIERALNLNLANTFNKILQFTGGNKIFSAYAKRYDIFNIKTILRGKNSKKSEEDILKTLIPVGELDAKFLKKMVLAKTKEDALDMLKGTEYFKILKKNEKSPLKEIEDELDKFYYENALALASIDNSFLNLLKTEIDMKNVLLLLKLRRKGLASAVNANRFINGGFLNVKYLLELSKRQEYEIVELLKKRKFWRFVPSNTKELEKIEASLRKYIMLEGFKMLKNYNNNFVAILGYFVAKEREVSNIRIIVRSKQVKSAEDSINIKSKLYLFA